MELQSYPSQGGQQVLLHAHDDHVLCAALILLVLNECREIRQTLQHSYPILYTWAGGGIQYRQSESKTDSSAEGGSDRSCLPHIPASGNSPVGTQGPKI